MQNFYSKLFLIAVILFPALNLAQNTKILPGVKELRVNERTNTPAFIAFDNKELPLISNFSSLSKKSFQMRKEDGLQFISKESDLIGFVHHRYQQTYNEIPVIGGNYIVHEKNGKIVSMNGDYYSNITLSNSISIDEKAAINSAKQSVGASIYKWELTGEENMMKKLLNNPEFSYSPKPELIILPINGEFKYAYKLDINAHQPYGSWEVFVDASNGNVLEKNSNMYDGIANGKAKTVYSDTVSIVTDSLAVDTFRLRDYTRGAGIITLNLNKKAADTARVNDFKAEDFYDDNNFWDNVNSKRDEAATDAHWGAEMTFDFYKNVLGRNSYDNNGGMLISFVHASDPLNAYWDKNNFMLYGDGGNAGGQIYNPFTALDVCGHELSHGVTAKSAKLVYASESGALNESFSDIFGATIEFYNRPNAANNWMIGEDVTAGALRNMANPNSLGDPDTYEGKNWIKTVGCVPGQGNDKCGVHTNSGVQNYWFYLLVKGGSGTNDNDSTYSVDSLGYEKAAKIAYRNLTVYLTENSNYRDACFYSIKAAEDLYGAGSTEVIQTTNAWFAAGLGQRYSAYAKADFEIEVDNCTPGFVFKFLNNSSVATSYKWEFGDDSTSTERSPVHTYINPGVYTVKLIATNLAGSDTMSKVNLIKYFSDAPVPVKCTPTVLDVKADDGIFNFKLGNFNYSSLSGLKEGGYKNNICQRIYVGADSTYEIEVNTGTTSLSYARVWIDANSDSTFTNSELLFLSDSLTGIHTGTVKIPLFANSGPLRLRVTGAPVKDNKADSICLGYIRYGQIEEYSIVISNSQPISVKTPSLERNLKIYPNPATEKINIVLEMESFEPVNIFLINMLGETIFNEKINCANGLNQDIDVSSLAKGVYLIKLNSTELNIIKKLVIK